MIGGGISTICFLGVSTFRDNSVSMGWFFFIFSFVSVFVLVLLLYGLAVTLAVTLAFFAKVSIIV